MERIRVFKICKRKMIFIGYGAMFNILNMKKLFFKNFTHTTKRDLIVFGSRVVHVSGFNCVIIFAKLDELGLLVV